MNEFQISLSRLLTNKAGSNICVNAFISNLTKAEIHNWEQLDRVFESPKSSDALHMALLSSPLVWGIGNMNLPVLARCLFSEIQKQSALPSPAVDPFIKTVHDELVQFTGNKLYVDVFIGNLIDKKIVSWDGFRNVFGGCANVNSLVSALISNGFMKGMSDYPADIVAHVLLNLMEKNGSVATKTSVFSSSGVSSYPQAVKPDQVDSPFLSDLRARLVELTQQPVCVDAFIQKLKQGGMKTIEQFRMRYGAHPERYLQYSLHQDGFLTKEVGHLNSDAVASVLFGLMNQSSQARASVTMSSSIVSQDPVSVASTEKYFMEILYDQLLVKGAGESEICYEFCAYLQEYPFNCISENDFKNFFTDLELDVIRNKLQDLINLGSSFNFDIAARIIYQLSHPQQSTFSLARGGLFALEPVSDLKQFLDAAVKDAPEFQCAVNQLWSNLKGKKITTLDELVSKLRGCVRPIDVRTRLTDLELLAKIDGPFRQKLVNIIWSTIEDKQIRQGSPRTGVQ